MAFGESMQLDLSRAHGAHLRLAGINQVPAMASLVDCFQAGLFHTCSISFAGRFCNNGRRFARRT